MMLNKYILSSIFFPLLCCCQITAAQELSPTEKKITEIIIEQQPEALSFLETLVNINSDTHNISGIKTVGNLVAKEFSKIGFTTEWVPLPAEMERADTLIMRRKGNQGKHLLLIGHLDTVFSLDSDFQHFERQGNLAKGPGVADDKGGVILMLYALNALHEANALENTNITIVLTGDEEDSGKPSHISRIPLIKAAKDVDIALDFEPGTPNSATVARRGISNWALEVQGQESHSSTIFQPNAGFGAIFEASRILDTIRTQLGSEKYFSFNPGIMVGGTSADISEKTAHGEGYGKHNVVSKIALANGDFRFISSEQKDFAKRLITEIVKHHLPGTRSKITFTDAIPAMPPNPENYQLLEIYSQASLDLGFKAIEAVDPLQRGAADISHVANMVPACLGGLGPIGSGMHSNQEAMDIKSLNMNTQRAALFIYRLIHIQ